MVIKAIYDLTVGVFQHLDLLWSIYVSLPFKNSVDVFIMIVLILFQYYLGFFHLFIYNKALHTVYKLNLVHTYLFSPIWCFLLGVAINRYFLQKTYQLTTPRNFNLLLSKYVTITVISSHLPQLRRKHVLIQFLKYTKNGCFKVCSNFTFYISVMIW